jgi:hypothetical protein
MNTVPKDFTIDEFWASLANPTEDGVRWEIILSENQLRELIKAHNIEHGIKH